MSVGLMAFHSGFIFSQHLDDFAHKACFGLHRRSLEHILCAEPGETSRRRLGRSVAEREE